MEYYKRERDCQGHGLGKIVLVKVKGWILLYKKGLLKNIVQVNCTEVILLNLKLSSFLLAQELEVVVDIDQLV